MLKIKDVPIWIWLWLVPTPYIAQFIFLYLDTGKLYFHKVFTGEAGIIEIGTALFLFFAVIFAIPCIRLAQQRKLTGMSVLLSIYAVGCFLLLGEEISWGQHVFDWQSPDYFIENNEKNETNLHNMGFINRSIAKWIVVIGMVAGGVVLPLTFRWRKSIYSAVEHWISWLFPTTVCVPVGLIVFVSHISSKNGFLDTAAVEAGLSLRESTELYISIFFLIYVASLYIRMKSSNAGKGQERVIGP